MSASILLLPGIGNSGPGHWQTLWADTHASTQRIDGQDWDNPVCAKWVDNLEAAIRRSGSGTVLVAHSLACLQVAHWAQRSSTPIKAALLVAVPDPDAASFPSQATGFSPLELQRFAFPSIVVASSDDPYGSLEHSQRCAQGWGSRLVEIGARGHINAGSGLGDWVQGWGLLGEWVGG
jgi:predicted alpha/beta hydrolase family esterase